MCTFSTVFHEPVRWVLKYMVCSNPDRVGIWAISTDDAATNVDSCARLGRGTGRDFLLPRRVWAESGRAERLDPSAANQEASEAVTAVSGVLLGTWVSYRVSDHIPEPTTPSTRGSSKPTFLHNSDHEQVMPLRSFNPCFGFPRRVGAVAASCFLAAFEFAFVVLCFVQLGGKQARCALCPFLVWFLIERTGSVEQGRLGVRHRVLRRHLRSRAFCRWFL